MIHLLSEALRKTIIYAILLGLAIVTYNYDRNHPESTVGSVGTRLVLSITMFYMLRIIRKRRS